MKTSEEDNEQIESINELATAIGKNITIGKKLRELNKSIASTNIFKQADYVNSLRDLDLSTML